MEAGHPAAVLYDDPQYAHMQSGKISQSVESNFVGAGNIVATASGKSILFVIIL